MLRIGNASGFYGDRFEAVHEMLTDGPLDVLTGDYLAELTMLILARDRAADPALGYAKTFLRQMEKSLALAMDQGVKIVVNMRRAEPRPARRGAARTRRRPGADRPGRARRG